MRLTVLAIIVLIVHGSCRERYGLPMEKGWNNSLVIEGNILQGDTTVIRLSRMTAVSERELLPETGAVVRVVGSDNIEVSLTETAPGVYKAAPIDLNTSSTYRLMVSAGGKEYESDWLELINTPPIDTVFWERKQGVEIFVRSSGSTGDTRFYKWDYDEVWDFYSKYKSYAYFTTNGVDQLGQPIPQCVEREKDGITYTTCVDAYGPLVHNDSMYHCWKYNNSNNINIGSTAALSENVMQARVRVIENDGFELTSLYSILVKQTGLSKDAYEFYKILQGNSEGMGSIFDAQPSQLRTNIKCVSHPSEYVIGFIDATSVKSKRLFIKNSEVGQWNYNPFSCFDTVYQNTAADVADAVQYNQVPAAILKTQPQSPNAIIEYSTSGRFCMDCRLRGIHRKPDFWP